VPRPLFGADGCWWRHVTRDAEQPVRGLEIALFGAIAELGEF
jgi:hypothetical protein